MPIAFSNCFKLLTGFWGFGVLGFGGLKGKPGKMGGVLNSYNAAA